jgi:copper(I)-binding protein
LLAFCCSCVAAVPGPSVSSGWIRALPGDLPAAGYLTLHNPGDHAIDLVRVSGSRFDSVMLHRSERVGGSERMVAVERVPVPGHGEVAFAPEGLHLMLMDAKPSLKVGETVDLRFEFSEGSPVIARFVVKDTAATGP